MARRPNNAVNAAPSSPVPKPRTTSTSVAPARTISYTPKRTSGMKSGTLRTAMANASLYSPKPSITAHRKNAKK